MQRDILYAITEHYNSLTRSGKKLADYIFANKTNVQYMSITSLAENSNVSEATITRFCKELGMSGYNDFKLSLAKANGALTMKISSEEFETTTDDTDFKTICKKLFVVNVTALKETLHLLDESSALQAIQMLSTANRVYCFGQGGSNLMAKEAWARFSTATSKFIHIEDSHMQAVASSLCNSLDVILFFSYSGSTKDMKDILIPAKKAGAKIILITHFSKSPASEYADVILLCGSKESPLESGSVAAKMGQLFIIDYLFYVYCQSNKAICESNLETTATVISSKLL